MVCNCRQGRVEKATKEMVYFLKEVFDSKLLAKNLLLVVTHVSQSKAALKQRQASRKSLDLILQDISMRISTAFGQPDRLPCFDIDTAPVRLQNTALVHAFVAHDLPMSCQLESHAQPYQFLGCLTLQLW